MPIVQCVVIIFALLTIYFTYIEYKKRQQLKNVFIIILVLEMIVVIGSLFALFM